MLQHHRMGRMSASDAAVLTIIPPSLQFSYMRHRLANNVSIDGVQSDPPTAIKSISKSISFAVV